MFKDILLRDIHVGDIIAAPRAVTSSPFLDLGMVVKINPKTLNIHEVKCREWQMDPDTREWSLVDIPAKLAQIHRVNNPQRTLKVDLLTLPEAVIKEFEKVDINGYAKKDQTTDTEIKV